MNYVDEMRSLCVVSNTDVIIVAEEGLMKIFINPSVSNNEYIEIKLNYDTNYIYERLKYLFPTYCIRTEYDIILIKDTILYDIIDVISDVFVGQTISVKYFTNHWAIVSYLLVELSSYANNLYLNVEIKAQKDVKSLINILEIINEDDSIVNISIYISGNINLKDLKRYKLDKRCKLIVKSTNHMRTKFVENYGLVYEDIINCA